MVKVCVRIKLIFWVKIWKKVWIKNFSAKVCVSLRLFLAETLLSNNLVSYFLYNDS